jgi:hypothetical protein
VGRLVALGTPARLLSELASLLDRQAVLRRAARRADDEVALLHDRPRVGEQVLVRLEVAAGILGYSVRRSHGEMASTEKEIFDASTPQDVTSTRAKSQRHRKSTADKWNQ